MEIHELNTFSGTPGASDFFVTDNGTDTSKISAYDLVAPLNARIDNIIAGDAPSAEEVIDARLGADGKTYTSLGVANRTQFTNITDDLIALHNNEPSSVAVTFSSASQNVDMTFHVYAGMKYYIECTNTDVSRNVLVMVKGDTSYYKAVGSSTGKVEFIPASDGTLRFFNQTNGYVGTVNFTISSLIVDALSHKLDGYGNITTAAKLSEITGGTYSADDFPANSILAIGANIGSLVNGVNISGSKVGTYTTYSPSNKSNTDGTLQRFVSIHGLEAVRVKTSGTWSEWKREDGLQIKFATSSENVTLTTTMLKANRKYLLSFDDDSVTGHFNAYVTGDQANYVELYSGVCTEYVPSIDGYLRMFNGTSGGFTGELLLTIEETSESIYYVGGSSANQSLTQLLIDLKDDTRKKVIYINPGTYDIFQEYRDAEIETPPNDVSISDYLDRCVFLPKNTKLIGLGNVTLEWKPAFTDITIGEARTWSPLNVRYGCYVENITIEAKYARYCIHDDSHNAVDDQEVEHIYKNIRCNLESNSSDYGTNNTIGLGFSDKDRYVFEDCYFEVDATSSAVYGHGQSSGNIENGASVVVKNTIIKNTGGSAVRLQGLNTTLMQIKTLFVNCYISSGLRLQNSAGTSGKAVFDVTLLKSGTPTITDDYDSANPYPVEIYN